MAFTSSSHSYPCSFVSALCLATLNSSLYASRRKGPASSSILTLSASWLTNTYTRASPPVLPRRSTGATISSAAAGEGQDQFSHSRAPRSALPLATVVRGCGEDIFSSPMPPPDRWEGLSYPQAWVTHSPTSRVSCIVLPKWGTGPTDLSAAASEGQAQLSHPHDSGPALSPATGPGGCGWGLRITFILFKVALVTLKLLHRFSKMWATHHYQHSHWLSTIPSLQTFYFNDFFLWCGAKKKCIYGYNTFHFEILPF